MFQEENFIPLKEELEGRVAQEIMAFVYRHTDSMKVVITSSFSIEDQVLTHMALEFLQSPRIITLDTGRLPEETYQVMATTRKEYQLPIEIYFPAWQEVESMTRRHGPNLFRHSVEYRQECCRIRKTLPLKRALKGAEVWINGQRREQSPTRSDIPLVQWDPYFALMKITPLLDWTEEKIWDYIHAHRIPYNSLYDKGYRSIGCAPCSRAVKKGEDPRAGRWWWENPRHKECGIHSANKKN